MQMKVVGLITEYNPFHNGHKYHIQEAKRITGADYVIAVMSGNFVQRGTPAIIDKYSRTKMALQNGIDLVLELPVAYATASAEFFAQGAVALLDKLGLVDYLCFGSECGDINALKKAATFLLSPPDGFYDQILLFLKDGLTYPAARMKAFEQYSSLKNNSSPNNDFSKILAEPNNILGIEYIKALQKFSSPIIPITIRRQSAHYHDVKLSDYDNATAKNALKNISIEQNKYTELNIVISSATAIRHTLQTIAVEDLYKMKDSVPLNVFETLTQTYGITSPMNEEDFSKILKYKLLSETKDTLTQYVDISADLADRMKNICSYDEHILALAKRLKTKNLTQTRINRALIHLLLNIKKVEFNRYNQKGYTPYARVLGIKKESSHLLRKITNSESIPVITKVPKATQQLDATGMQMLSEDLFASHIYNQAVYEKYNTSIPNEYKHGICIL